MLKLGKVAFRRVCRSADGQVLSGILDSKLLLPLPLIVLLLDGRHRVMGQELVSQGTLTASLVHPREVFRPALRACAASLVLVHNHPSGDPTPSAEDRDVTTRLARAGEILGVRIVDHVVVAERGYCSLREEGLLET